MRETKVIIIFSFLFLIITFPLTEYLYSNYEVLYNILISINTGIISTMIVSLCQYFVIKKKIIDNIFNSYFDLYKAIYVSEEQKLFLHYGVTNIYKQLIITSNEVSKKLSEFSEFTPKKISKKYRKLNPQLSFDNKIFNVKNIIKLMLPINSKRFKTIVIPYKMAIEKILIEIDKKKFEKEFSEYKILYKKILGETTSK